MNFRELLDGETRILLVRHAPHEKNVITPDGKVQCHLLGMGLKLSGIDINSVYTSPAARTHSTAIEILMGYGKMVYMRTDDRLADLAIEDEALVKAIKDYAKEHKQESDEGMNEFVFLPSLPAFRDLMVRRAEEGADALTNIAEDYPGKTVMVVSHGVGRIEPMIISLRGRQEIPSKMAKLLSVLGVIELIIKNGEELTEENWL